MNVKHECFDYLILSQNEKIDQESMSWEIWQNYVSRWNNFLSHQYKPARLTFRCMSPNSYLRPDWELVFLP